jgi:hypothetical protein
MAPLHTLQSIAGQCEKIFDKLSVIGTIRISNLFNHHQAMECIMETKTYSKLFPAKMAAAKLTKKHGIKYIFIPVEGGFNVLTEAAYAEHKAALASKKAPAQGKAKRVRTTKRGLKLGEHIPNGEASFEDQVAALWVFVELTGDLELADYIKGMPRERLSMIFGSSKTRWGAIGNVRAALAAAQSAA